MAAAGSEATLIRRFPLFLSCFREGTAAARGPGARRPTRARSPAQETMMTTHHEIDRQKSNRGFASMDLGKQREIASKGGKAAHAQGRAHEFTAEEARVAGRKGGEAVSRDRAHMAAIGRAGGQARGRNRALAASIAPSAMDAEVVARSANAAE
jgi:general stress protein YciG